MYKDFKIGRLKRYRILPFWQWPERRQLSDIETQMFFIVILYILSSVFISHKRRGKGASFGLKRLKLKTYAFSSLFKVKAALHNEIGVKGLLAYCVSLTSRSVTVY